MKIAEGVEMLELVAEGFGGRSVLHPTLVYDENEAVLIDTGMPGQWDEIAEAMEELHVPISRLKAVILTHQDVDHIGSLPEVVIAKADIEVLAHRLDRPYIEGEIPLLKTNLSVMKRFIQTMQQEHADEMRRLCENLPKAPVTRVVEDGEVLPYCGGMEILHTPGHTPGHVSVYLQRSKVLVAGDAMICVHGKIEGPVKRTTPDLASAYSSIRRFTRPDIERVICYHGGAAVGDIKDQIERLIESNRK